MYILWHGYLHRSLSERVNQTCAFGGDYYRGNIRCRLHHLFSGRNRPGNEQKSVQQSGHCSTSKRTSPIYPHVVISSCWVLAGAKRLMHTKNNRSSKCPSRIHRWSNKHPTNEITEGNSKPNWKRCLLIGIVSTDFKADITRTNFPNPIGSK